MTEHKAIKLIRVIITTQNLNIHKESYCDRVDALLMAIQALEKQIPKKPLLTSKAWDNDYECPICGNSVTDHNDCKLKCCRECGQKLDWSEEE